MKRLLILLSLALPVLFTAPETRAQDATPIHISMRDSTGQALDRLVTFTPLDGVRGFSGTNVVPPMPIEVQPVNGVADTNLVIGNYRVTFKGLPSSLTIFWPGDTSITNLADPRVQRTGMVGVFVMEDTNTMHAIAAEYTDGLVANGSTDGVELGGGSGSYITANATTLPFSISDVLVDAVNGWLSFLGFDNGIVAKEYLGSAASLTNANATTLFGTGTIPLARLSGITTGQFAAATISLMTNRAGDGGGFSNLNGATLQSASVFSNAVDPGTQSLFTNLHKAFRIPQQFGAVGDGTTDDTAALQRWLNFCSSNYCTAKLPPAPGGYYKITDTLYVTNGIQIEGGSGGKHTTASYPTPAQIRQFTRNKTGLRLLSAADSLHINNITVIADPPNNFTNSACYGIYFDGGAPDSDCSVVSQVGAQNFGIGFYAVSVADTKFVGCSPGYNSIGIYIAGVANNVTLEGGQYSYNYSNQVYAGAADGLIISGCDIAAETPSAQGCYFQNNVNAIFVGSRFEDYSTNHMLICGSTNGGAGVKLTLVATKFYSSIDYGTNRAAIAATNADITLINVLPNNITYQPKDFLFKGTDANTHVWSVPPVAYVDYTSSVRTNYAYAFATNVHEFTNSIPANSLQGVKLASQTITGDKVAAGTITATNTVGASAASYVLSSGDILSISNGLVLSLTPIVWDTDALAYFTLASINNITQKVAVNYLVTQSKSIGLWTNSIAIYPVTGDYMSNAVYNLRTNAFHMVNHSCTYSATGIVVRAASSAYMDTLWTPTTANIAGATKDSIHLGIYLEDTSIMPVGSITVMGMYDDFARLGVGYNFSSFGMAGFSANNVITAGGPYMTTNTIGDVRGPVLATRTGSAAQALYFKTLSATTTDSSSALAVSAPVTIGARNQYGGQSQFANMTFAGASIGAGINSTMAAQVQAMWDTYNLILGRKVP